LGNVFYAKNIDELESKERYDINLDFEKIQEFFTHIKPEEVLHYKAEAFKIMEITK